MRRIYISSPYTVHGDAHDFGAETQQIVREARWRAAREYAREIIEGGEFGYSPIAYTHPLHMLGTRPPQGWLPWDLEAIRDGMFNGIHVLKLPGWKDSSGINAEIRAMKEIGVDRLTFADPSDRVWEAYGLPRTPSVADSIRAKMRDDGLIP